MPKAGKQLEALSMCFLISKHQQNATYGREGRDGPGPNGPEKAAVQKVGHKDCDYFAFSFD